MQVSLAKKNSGHISDFCFEKYMKIIKLQQNVQNAEYKLPVKEI